ncbi:MAG TPA: zinc ribbon domain-containing protein [Pirellulaceae bacterium]|nr:zinc ribbon domain-containing protein [Pirellulaceae bacterium]
MTAMQFSCPHCRGLFQVELQSDDQQVACPHCGGHVGIPAAESNPVGFPPETNVSAQGLPNVNSTTSKSSPFFPPGYLPNEERPETQHEIPSIRTKKKRKKHQSTGNRKAQPPFPASALNPPGVAPSPAVDAQPTPDAVAPPVASPPVSTRPLNAAVPDVQAQPSPPAPVPPAPTPPAPISTAPVPTPPVTNGPPQPNMPSESPPPPQSLAPATLTPVTPAPTAPPPTTTVPTTYAPNSFGLATPPPSNPVMPTGAEVPAHDTHSIHSPDEVPTDGLAAPAATADPDEEYRALVEARAHRRLVKNLILVSICLLLLVATLWALLVVGPL